MVITRDNDHKRKVVRAKSVYFNHFHLFVSEILCSDQCMAIPLLCLPTDCESLRLHDALSLQCVDACMKLDTVAMRHLVNAWQQCHATLITDRGRGTAQPACSFEQTTALLPRIVAMDLLAHVLPTLVEQSKQRLEQRAAMHRQRLADLKDYGFLGPSSSTDPRVVMHQEFSVLSLVEQTPVPTSLARTTT